MGETQSARCEAERLPERKLPRGTTSGNRTGMKRLHSGTKPLHVGTPGHRDGCSHLRDTGRDSVFAGTVPRTETQEARMERPPFEVIGSFSSLDELFDELEGQYPPVLPHGGSVRLHPQLLPEQAIGAFVAARVRLEQRGLRLILTPAVGMQCVELRRHTRPGLRVPV